MKEQNIKILAIESSCDETAAAVIGMENGLPVILSSIISSQVDLHAKTGGVVPEVASRAHMEAIMPVIVEALLKSKQQKTNPKQAQKFNNQNFETISDFGFRISDFYPEAISLLNDITHIAVTAGPGLVGSLLVGFNAAKSLAFATDKPIIAVNHIEGHIYSAFGGEMPKAKCQISNPELPTPNCQLQVAFPILALTVSGGHTSLTLMKDHGIYENLGSTLDDAVGEAYDKVAKLLALSYPGGPIISKLAQEHRDSGARSSELGVGDNKSKITIDSRLSTSDLQSPIAFPRPIMKDGSFNFSFSGLKTSVLHKVMDLRKVTPELSEVQIQEIAAAFEEAVADVLTYKTAKAIEQYQPASVIFAGGVSANKYLRFRLQSMISQLRTPNSEPPIFLTPPLILCGDNAAMIGIAAFYHIQNNKISNWNEIKVDSNLPLS